jgi:Cu-Zn family superoxide dismutase
MKREIAALAATVLVGASGAWAATADGTPGRDRTGGGSHPGHHEDGHDPGHDDGHDSWHDDEHWVTLRDTSGHRVGSVVLRQRDETVEISARVSSLTPGFHGFHVHQVGLCEPGATAGPFTTAGGHFPGGDPGGVTVHGEHAGDMPSLLAGEDGRAKLRLRTDRFTLEDLRDPDGSAVMVHSGPDNFANIPERYTTGGTAGPDATTLGTGDSGSRVACGVID